MSLLETQCITQQVPKTCLLVYEFLIDILRQYSNNIFPKTETDQSSELLWNWRVSVFAPYLELFAERVALEKQELTTHLGSYFVFCVELIISSSSDYLFTVLY